MGHPDCRQGGDLLKAGCLTCYLVALRAVLASIIVAAFFVSMNFCGGSMVSISGGGGIGPKNLFSRIYKIHSYLGRIVGSNFEGGGSGPKSNLGPKKFCLAGSRVSISGGGRTEMRFRGIHPFFVTLLSHVPYSWGVKGTMFSDPGSSLDSLLQNL